ncbi:MAG: MBL fold metallo-hydrolase [Candidatus Hermodarchaeota archaeon]|nr:MBL fold metallo-hydrolase [Candidatus Hermodarchaeota archaeon]
MLTFTYHGLACVELEFAIRLLLNPGTSPHEELELLATLNPDYVFVSHSAPEYSGFVPNLPDNPNRIIFSNAQVVANLQESGVDESQLQVLNHAETCDFGQNVTVTAYEQSYEAERLLTNTMFLVTDGQASVLHLGRAQDLSGLADCCPNLLCIPIAGPTMGVFTPQAAAEVATALGPSYVLPLLGDIAQSTQFDIAVGAQKKRITRLFPAEGEVYTVPIYDTK